MPPFLPRPSPRKPAPPVSLTAPIGDRRRNAPSDLERIAAALARLGDYRPEAYGRSRSDPAVWDGALVGALARFQEREGLKVDALALPGGPTERRLAQRLSEQDQRERRHALPVTPEELLRLRGLGVDEHERRLRRAGFSYEPDRLGRLGQGDWRDRNGCVIAPGELQAVLRELLASEASAGGAKTTRPAAGMPQPRQDRGEARPNEDTDNRYLDRWAEKGWGGPRGPHQVPTLSNERERIENILADRPARFNIQDNPDADEGPAWWESPELAMWAVNRNNAAIEESSVRHGLDPDLLRAILWAETARGHKGGLDELADDLGFGDSQRPININSDLWAGLIGETPSAIKDDPRKNIEAATVLLKRIAERLDDPTPAKIGSIWNFAGREKVSDFGAATGRIYREKPWNQGHEPTIVPLGAP